MPRSAALPATITTTESFPGNTARARLEREVQLRLAAGAIRSTFQRNGGQWILTTEWNVIGGNA